MPEGLEASVGVDRQLAFESERAALEVLLLAEAEVLVGEQLRHRKTVVELRELDLLPRVGDAGLRVRLLRGGDRRLPAEEIEARILLRIGGGRERERGD